MYLKRMELSGFKSFADRTELEFVPGVTAVVGPNGSGKSNISDSIRWVLGEQSAKNLRGSKMEDVIFAGSDSRKSVNFCEVSLTLDNSDSALPLDFQEVTITRRVYRSGESEYLINRNPCRLKDIQELFMDTGLGKEAYSVIGQGRIEEILSTKSEDRRGIFEEAAGIVRYKSRKKEAEKRLDETETNLIRIFDLLHEIESNLGPLQKQKETAEHYKQLKAELASEEIALLVFTIQDLDAKWKSMSQAIETAKQDTLSQNVEITTAEAEMTVLKTASDQKEAELNELQAVYLTAATEWEQCEGHKKLLLERISSTSHLLEEANQAEERLLEERQSIEREIQDQQQMIEELESTVSELTAKIHFEQGNAEHALMKSRLEQTLEAHKAELIHLMNQAAVARNELRNQETNRELMERRLERFKQEESEWTLRVVQLQGEIDRLTNEIKELTEEWNQREAETAKRVERRKKLQTEWEELNGALRRLQTEQASRNSRLDLLRDMQQEYGGYNIGVRTVLQAADKGQLSGVCGAVADLIQVPREYEVAVETALGGALQHVVVETEKAGKDSILFLKRSGGGRSTFLPLDVIRPRSMAGEDKRSLMNHSGFVGMANELVSSDERYKSIVSYLLGGVVVAKTIHDATELARSTQYRLRIVTLDGDVINPGGSMSGGSQQKRSTSLLGRTREIADLEQECTQIQKDIQLAERKLQSIQTEVNTAAKEFTLAEERLAELKAEIAERESRKRELQIEWKSSSEKASAASYEKEQTQKDLESVTTQMQSTAEQLKQSTFQEESCRAQVEQMERELRLLEEENADLSEELTQLKVQLAAKDQELLSRREHVRRLIQQLEQLKQELDARQKDRSLLTERLTGIRAELAESESRLEMLQQEKINLEAQLQTKREERFEQLRQLSLQADLVRELREQLKQKEASLHQNEVALARLDVELSSHLERLATEYQMSFEWAKSHYSIPEDVGLSRKKVQSLKLQIERLGEVNLGAIEEYERQTERFTFLETQKNDLVEAKAKLYEVISDLDGEMAKKFTETFAEIRTHFIEVFAALFGGGRADLILVNPEYPLTTGIDIVAQPPGKKLQNLSLLSGGERALTAIALLFAILKVKPVPFCVLDEVEAALDEANVSRYAQYLRAFSSQTQFIAITHRRGTMEGADVLYGVTMEESGISKLVSVKMLDHQEVAATG